MHLQRAHYCTVHVSKQVMATDDSSNKAEFRAPACSSQNSVFLCYVIMQYLSEALNHRTSPSREHDFNSSKTLQLSKICFIFKTFYRPPNRTSKSHYKRHFKQSPHKSSTLSSESCYYAMLINFVSMIWSGTKQKAQQQQKPHTFWQTHSR